MPGWASAGTAFRSPFLMRIVEPVPNSATPRHDLEEGSELSVSVGAYGDHREAKTRCVEAVDERAWGTRVPVAAVVYASSTTRTVNRSGSSLSSARTSTTRRFGSPGPV